MSKVSYKTNHFVYYTIAWSVLEDGKRDWKINKTFSKTPETAFKETEDSILLAKRPDFEMKLVGYRFE